MDGVVCSRVLLLVLHGRNCAAAPQVSLEADASFGGFPCGCRLIPELGGSVRKSLSVVAGRAILVCHRQSFGDSEDIFQRFVREFMDVRSCSASTWRRLLCCLFRCKV